MIPGIVGKEKADDRFGEGIYLGITTRSEEYIIGTKDGVLRARSIKRKGNREEQWNVEQFKELRGTPWEPIPGREGIEIKSKIDLPAEEGMPEPIQEPEDREIIIRRAGITKADIKEHGQTP